MLVAGDKHSRYAILRDSEDKKVESESHLTSINPSRDKSKNFTDTNETLDKKPLFTKSYTSQANGKAKR